MTDVNPYSQVDGFQIIRKSTGKSDTKSSMSCVADSFYELDRQHGKTSIVKERQRLYPDFRDFRAL